MNRTIMVLPFMLLSFGCSFCVTPAPLFQTAPMVCGNRAFLAIVLVRNPSPAWHMKRSMRKAMAVATDLTREAYDGALDRLARVL